MKSLKERLEKIEVEESVHIPTLDGQGIAREALRSAMANGPYFPLLLPSVTFLPDEKPEAPAVGSGSRKQITTPTSSPKRSQPETTE